MTCDGADRFLMSFAVMDAIVQPRHMASRPMPAIQANHVGCFPKGPLQVMVHIRAYPAEADLAPGGVDPRRGSGVPGEVRGVGEPMDIADLEKNHEAQDEAYARQGHEAGQPGRLGEDLAHPRFELEDLFFNEVELFQ
jgi:hypothetical protein